MGQKKTCSCGESYDTRAWSRLRLVGMLKDPEAPVELRDCTCGSCMGKEVPGESSVIVTPPARPSPLPKQKV